MVNGAEHLVMTWQYDEVGNNTVFQEVTDGVATTTITKQYDSASSNTFTRTETR